MRPKCRHVLSDHYSEILDSKNKIISDPQYGRRAKPYVLKDEYFSNSYIFNTFSDKKNGTVSEVGEV